jgi:hypothetical protein
VDREAKKAEVTLDPTQPSMVAAGDLLDCLRKAKKENWTGAGTHVLPSLVAWAGLCAASGFSLSLPLRCFWKWVSG